MDPTAASPETPEEHLIFWSITCTWGFYAIGALYLLAPALGWMLLALLIWRLYAAEAPVRLPLTALIWCGGMLVMLVALIVGHVTFALGAAQLVKSMVGWAKGWALMALFVLAGATLRIRVQVLARAINILALQTLLLVPLFLIAPHIGLPGRLFISPFSMLGGPGPEFFEVQLYAYGAGGEGLRWRFFSPWAPAAGMVANVSLVISWLDRGLWWRTAGVAAAVAVCLLSQSRLALLAVIIVPLLGWLLARLTQPALAMLAAAMATVAGITATSLIDLAEQAQARFSAARAASSRVRAALGRIAVQRWSVEAPWFGHGAVERGSHLVEFMPIGSHHTWYGLLFVKGMVGFGALAVPMLASFLEMLVKAQASRTARAGLAIMLILFFYTFGENLEILVYQFWPGLILLGRASSQRVSSPFRTLLAG